MQRTYVNNQNRVYMKCVIFFQIYTIERLDNKRNIQLQLRIIILIIFFFNSYVDCVPGHYGHKCEKACSGHCLNNTICDYIDGRCSDGCQPGYIGTLCDACKIFKSFIYSVLDRLFENKYVSNTYIFFTHFAACKIGYYGQNCSSVCSSDCKTCKPTDGTCSCSAGWMVQNCRIGIVFLKLFKNILSLKINFQHKMVNQFYILKIFRFFMIRPYILPLICKPT